VPTAPWRRRRVNDIPRPAGRRWAGRLRRGGSLARQVLAGRRPSESTTPRNEMGPDPHTKRRRFTLRRGAAGRGGTSVAGRPGRSEAADPADLLSGELAGVVPLSPAIPAPAGPVPTAGLNIPLLPGERTIGRRIRFAIVNGCTLLSLVLGVTAIFLSTRGDDLRLAALCLIACVVFDGLDGALARRLRVASPFGAQMDSLADMCSFGIAAPVVVHALLAGEAAAAVTVPACALVAVCAAIRLARFNVSPKDGRFFCGVPTTMVAAVLALGTLIAPAAPVALQVTAVVMLALAMVSSFPYVKLARLLRLPAWVLVLPVVGAFIDYQVTFAVVVLSYLLSGPVLWLRNRPA
jgi:CDP-diacylglycerol--serine O-phosphatidyltransferase